jgi:CheY-like chemotaxis protein
VALLQIAPLLTRIVGHDTNLEIEAETDCAVFINPSQFDQVILNLCTNARDAMPSGGDLRIELSTVNVTASSLEPGEYALLQVSDHGKGMDSSQVRRAFDPFFTTKPIGEGTGFGLSTVYRIATECGGTATIESEPGAGTSVCVHFPITEMAPVNDKTPDAVNDCNGDETILLVENESSIASLLHKDLRRRGYNVILASNGLEALDIVKQRGISQLDLIVSDVIMPKMTGPAFVGRLLEQGHHPKVLFMSGYTDEALAILGGESLNLLSKPFTPDQLALRVRKALDDPNS